MDGRRKVPTVTHRGRVFRLPFAGLFRPLTPAEDVELRTSIACIGVCHAVKVYDSPAWGPDCVIDGANRLRAAAELGLDLPVEKVEADDDEARRMAEDLNIARRQVTAAEAREARARRIERVADLRAQGMSTRAIAAEVGVSQSQVVADIREATEQGCSVEPEKVTGLDGRTVAATHKAPEPDDPDDAEPGAEPPPPLDDTPPQPSHDAARWRDNPFGKHKTGPVVDPDHPYAELLKAISHLAALISRTVNESEVGGKLRDYLFAAGWMIAVGKVVGDRHYGWKCRGLRGVYRLVKLAGKPGKPLTKSQVLKKYEDAMDPGEGDE